MAKSQLLAVLSCALALVAAVPAPMAGSADRTRMVSRAEEAEDPNKVDQTAQFNQPIALKGGNIQQDTTFPPGQNGVLEIEFSNVDGRTLTVVENRNPAPPPAGFVPLEPVSYVVQLSGGSADNLTVSKVDYIQDPTSKLDISKGQIGLLCTKTNTFMVGPAVGELEFEAEEKELSNSVANMNGEWAIFLPDPAAAAAGAGAGAASANTAAGKGNGTAASGAGAASGATVAGAGGVSNNALLDLFASLLSRVGAGGSLAA